MRSSLFHVALYLDFGTCARCGVFQMSISTENIDPELSKTSKIIKIGPIAFENDPNEIWSSGKKVLFFPDLTYVGAPALNAP